MSDIKVLTFGEVILDVYEGHVLPGGTPVNLSVGLNNLGVTPAIYGKVGKDIKGSDLVRFIESKGITTKYIQVGGEETSTVRIKLDKFKNTDYTIQDKASWDDIDYSESFDLDHVKYLICSTLSYRSEKNRSTLKQVMDKVSSNLVVDLNIRSPYYTLIHIEELLSKAKMVSVKYAEFVLIKRLLHIDQRTEKADLKMLMNKFPNIESILLYKRMESATYFSKSEYVTVRRKAIDVVDPVGASSAILAGFIAAQEYDMDIKDALSFACACRDLVVSNFGPNMEFSRQDVVKYL